MNPSDIQYESLDGGSVRCNLYNFTTRQTSTEKISGKQQCRQWGSNQWAQFSGGSRRSVP